MSLVYFFAVLVLISYGIAGTIVVCWLFCGGAKNAIGALWKGSKRTAWREAHRENVRTNHTGWSGIQTRENRSVDTFEQAAVRLMAVVARIGFTLAILITLAILLFLLLAMSR